MLKLHLLQSLRFVLSPKLANAQDLMRHNKDVIVPNVWRPLPDWLGGEQPCMS
jgi:hypothetical protein